MKIFKLIAFLLIAPLIAVAEDGVIVERIVATIDGEPFTSSDLDKYISSKHSGDRGLTLDNEALARKYLQEMVFDNLLEKEADKSGIGVEDSEIEAYIEEIRRQNSLDEKGFAALLSERNLTEEEYQSQVKRDILRNRLISTKVRSKVSVLDEEINEYFAKNPELLPGEGEVDLHQIFLPGDVFSKSNLERKLSEMKRRLESGSNWASVGSPYYSRTGVVEKKNLLLKLQTAIEDLPVGDVSNVVVTPAGGYLVGIAASGKQGGKPQIDPMLMESVRQELLEKRMQQKLNEYFTVELPKAYHIEYKL